MTDTQMTVHYERKFSDGNYGSEGLSLTYSVIYEDDGSDLAIEQEVISARLDLIAGILREEVLGQLAKSEAFAIARAAQRELNPPPPRQPGAAGPERDLEEMPF